MKKFIIFVLVMMCLSFLVSCGEEGSSHGDFELKQETESTETKFTETESTSTTDEEDASDTSEDGVWSKFY